MSTVMNAPTKHKRLLAWVEEIAALTEPDAIHWFDGSDAEADTLCAELVAAGHVRSARPREAAELLLGRHRPVGRRPGRGPHVHLLRDRGRRRPHQQLEGPGGDARHPRRPLPGLHEGPHDVRGPVQHGPARLAALLHRRRGHRLAVRRREHAHDDPRRQGRARRPRRRRRLRALRALARRAARRRRGGLVVAVQPRHQVHRALPGDTRDLVVRLRLRRQRAARQEVLRAAHRVGDRARRGLARRAHAHPQAHEPEGRGPLHRGRVPVGLRQDQPRDAHPVDPRLEGRDRRRRHRVDEVRSRRPPARDQPRVRLLRRRARARTWRPTRTRCTRSTRTPCSPTSRSPTTATSGGRAWTAPPPAHAHRLEAQRLDARVGHARRAPELPLLLAGVAVPGDRRRVGGPEGRADLGRALRRPPRHHGAARLRVARLAPRRVRRRHDGLGEDGRRVRRDRRPAPRPVRDAARSAATTWATTSRTGCR